MATATLKLVNRNGSGFTDLGTHEFSRLPGLQERIARDDNDTIYMVVDVLHQPPGTARLYLIDDGSLPEHEQRLLGHASRKREGVVSDPD